MPVPLRDRVTAPDVAPLPDGGLRRRPATAADLDRVVALHRVADPVGHPHHRTSREELEHEPTASWVDLENPSGALRLYASVGFRPATGSVAFVQEV